MGFILITIVFFLIPLLLLLCQYVITIIIPGMLLLLLCQYVITIIMPVCYYYYYASMLLLLLLISQYVIILSTFYQPYFIMIFAPGAVLLAPGLQWHPQRSPAAVPGEVSLRARRDRAAGHRRCKRWEVCSETFQVPRENHGKLQKIMEHDGKW